MKHFFTLKIIIATLTIVVFTNVKSISQNTSDTLKTPHVSVFKKRMTAALLTVTMGPLGAHRIYLGCSPHVPVAYVATVGGGVGLIPVIDFFAILFTRDFSTLEHNNSVFMWLPKTKNNYTEE
ncbi:MAG: TM2 domain-containing protein [Bacteroidia bacterium]|nr:TM2 domain-containing protein [Bacteroidia bacterium]